jgi:two-component system phosphate regulon sensor histidine kinase PhoR
MFRRLVSSFGLLLLLLFAAFVLGVAAVVEPGEPRARLLGVWAGVAGAGLLALVAVSAWTARQITRPLGELARAAERLAAGDRRARAFTGTRDELGALGRTFNRMSESLALRISRLEEDRQQLRTILSGMVEGVVALDADQRVLFANDRAAQLLEFPNPAPVGRRFWEVVRHRPLLDIVKRALDQAEPCRQEMSWNGTTSRSLTVHAARLPGMPPADGVRGAVLVLHDTSELRRLERLRQDFVANVSHELKTPLSVIKLCAETLLDGAVEDVEHRGHFLEQIANQSNRLHALILDLLSLARIESGEEAFEFEPVPVGPLVGAALERYRTRAEARRQTLEAEGPDGEVAAWADQEAVEQILDNLLDNAIKYTPEGGRIAVGWRNGDGQVCLEVSDTGIGIPEADLPRIFERFYRVDKARSREMGGTGLGLAIVKHLVQAMHGSVRARSRPGQGTTFTVCLPLAPGA